MSVELFGNGDARTREALAVRFAVFVDEQRVPPEMEIDEHDELDDGETVHAIVRRGATAVAAGRFYRRDAETAQVGRMAVIRDARGRGAGRALLDALLHEAARRGYRRVRLSAQTHAIAFYEKAGFAVVGGVYDDAGIPHRDMEREV